MTSIQQIKILLLAVLFLSFADTHSQITIGQGNKSAEGAILQLKENSQPGVNSIRGLLMPRVKLLKETDTSMPATMEGAGSWNLIAHTVPGTNICPGLYVWDGSHWIRMHDPCPVPCTISIASTSGFSRCDAGSVILTVTGTPDATLKIYDVSSGGNQITGSVIESPSGTYKFTFTANATATYYAELNDASCSSARYPVTATVNASPATPMVTSPVNLCYEATTDLNSAVTSIGTAYWFPNSTTTADSDIISNVSAIGTSGTYYVRYKSGNCYSAPAAVTVNVAAEVPLPTVTTPIDLCYGATTDLKSAVTSAGTAYWFPNSTTTADSDIISNVSAIGTAGTYYVRYKSGNCCSAPAAVTVNVSAEVPLPTVTTPIDLCYGTTTNLNSAVTSAGTGYWFPNSTTTADSDIISNVSAIGIAGTYYVRYKSGNCYSAPAAVTVTVRDCSDPCVDKAITVTNGVQALCLGSAIQTVTFTAGSPITVTGLLEGLTVSGNNSQTVTITGTPTVATASTTFTAATTATARDCNDDRKTFEVTVLKLDVSEDCGTITASGAPSGYGYKWYRDQTLISPQPTGATYTPTVEVETSAVFTVTIYNTSTGVEYCSQSVTIDKSVVKKFIDERDDEVYLYREFGDPNKKDDPDYAGVWMLQNLRFDPKRAKNKTGYEDYTESFYIEEGSWNFYIGDTEVEFSDELPKKRYHYADATTYTIGTYPTQDWK
ncbi:MAG: hypothetical protein E6767_14175 [Dysgonomonas sp.]|nr:hypothetical protein [Dysgonomonas sp.]